MKTAALLLGIVMALACDAFASPLVSETPVRDHGTASSVSASSSTWTIVPATDGQVGYFITLDPSSATDAYGTFDNTSTTTTIPIVFKAGITQFIPASYQDQLYVVSPSSAKTLYYCPVKQ